MHNRYEGRREKSTNLRATRPTRREGTHLRDAAPAQKERQQTMKINPIHGTTPVTTSYPVKRSSDPAKATKPPVVDQVSFSEEAKTLNKLVASAKDETRQPADEARIKDLTTRINRGTYKVDAETIADKMLKDILS